MRANGTRNKSEKVEKIAADSTTMAATLVYCEPWLVPSRATMCLRKRNKRKTIAIVMRILSDREREKNGIVQLIEPPSTQGELAET